MRRQISSLFLTPAALLIFSMPYAAQTPQTPVRLGVPEKVCQLTGELDWATGQPTAARTLSNYGLDAVDLGYPVEHNGKLILLFGDAWPSTHGNGPFREIIPDDAVAVTARIEPPTMETCLEMRVHSREERGGHKYAPATILSQPPVMQGFFNVPSGGVSVGNALYGFFWTHHCMTPGVLRPEPLHPLSRPAPTEACPQTNERNSLGSGVVARSEDGGFTFTYPAAMPEGFAYSTAVNGAVQIQLPDEQKMGVYIFGVPRYRASVPYLAMAPLDGVGDPTRWKFFNGMNAQGKPTWVGSAEWHAGVQAQIYTPQIRAGYNVGEFSVTWNIPLHLWVMMYAGGVIRVARAPWGPWSTPSVVLGAQDLKPCWITMAAKGCGTRRDYWPQRHPNGNYTIGGLYAPFILNRYTRPGPEPDSATIYFTISTWNPYQVSIMKSTIKMP